MAAFELKALVRAHIRANIEPEAVQAAAEQGHRILFIPPYHSDLQPIELLWARVNSNVGRKHTAQTTLDAEFEFLQTDEG